ncbi:TrmH family RNA methyltransferase [Arenimonas metalli]
MDAGSGRRTAAHGGGPRRPPSAEALAREEADAELLRGTVAGPRAPREQRIHGLNACLAMFARRPGDLRKVWLLESRIPALKAVLAHCVQHRLGYTVVGDEDLRKLSGSEHHEGVVFGAVPAPEQNLSEWLRTLPPGPQLAIWLDGVGNPHNLGAILRSAAHFGAAGLLLPKDSSLALSGAAARVAEGGAEQVPLVRLGRGDNSLAQLASAGFQAVATVVRGGESLYGGALPGRLLLVMGAEQSGLDPALAAAAARRVGIPGSGAVESLNVASATAVFLGEWWRQHRAG